MPKSSKRVGLQKIPNTMVKQLVVALAVASLSLISNATMAMKVQVDNWVTATNGCKFHVTGWVDVGISWNGIHVNHYDIDMDGQGNATNGDPCGDYHFNGMVAPDGNGGIIIMNATLTNNDTDKEDNISTSRFHDSLISILTQLEATLP